MFPSIRKFSQNKTQMMTMMAMMAMMQVDEKPKKTDPLHQSKKSFYNYNQYFSDVLKSLIDGLLYLFLHLYKRNSDTFFFLSFVSKRWIRMIRQSHTNLIQWHVIIRTKYNWVIQMLLKSLCVWRKWKRKRWSEVDGKRK